MSTNSFNSPGSTARAVAKSEIESLLHRYAVLAKDQAPFEEMAKLFRSDGVFRLPNGVVVKPSEIKAVVQGQEPDFVRHHITSVDMTFKSPNEAISEAYFFAVTHKTSIDHWGCWKDIVRRDSESAPWLIADRSVIVEGSDAQGWFREKYGPKL